MNCSDWIGGQSMGPSVDSSGDPLASKTFQGGIPGSETGKSVVGNGGLDSCEVVFMKDNVSVHPARFAFDRINGLLRLTKLGPSLFLTFTPPPSFDAGGRRGSSHWRTAEKDTNSHAIRAVSLAEIRSIRRHNPSVGLQYIIIVLSSGLSFPPLYFHAGGVNEFFATLRNHALLVRSIEDPSVYFVNSIHVQTREKQTMERDRDSQKNENKEEEHQMEKESETKDDQVQVPADPIPVGPPEVIYGSPPPDPMRHLDTPSRKRLRRSIPQDNTHFLPPPNEEIVLKYFSSFRPIRKKEKETDMNSAKEGAINKVQEAPFFDKETQVVGPSSQLDMCAGKPSPPSMEHLDTPSRKRLRRSMPQVLPSLPPPKEEIVLKFSTPIHGRNPRKYLELVLPPVAGVDNTSVCSRQRKTVDLVLSPVTAKSSHFDIVPTSPRSIPGVEPECSPQPRTLEEAPPAGAQDNALLQRPLVEKPCDDAAPFNALEYFSRLFCSSGFREGVALPVSWRNRLHLAEWSSEECAWARRRRDWWLGMRLSVSVATTIPSQVICSLFASELFMRLMVDSGLTYKALNSLKNIDKFGDSKHVTCGDICQFLKTLFSKVIRNRLRSARAGCAISGSAVDKGTDAQRSVVHQLANDDPLAASISLPQQPPGVPQPNNNREKRSRRWVRRSARAALRKVFVEWGCRQITPDETVALAARFHDNPDAMQIMQLFRNWANLLRRRSELAGCSTSHAQPTAGDRSRKRTESASPTQDAQQDLPPKKKPSGVHYNGSPQPQSQPSGMEGNALILAREVLLEAFQDKGYREITVDEALALAVRFQGSPNASQIQLLFGKWAQEKRRRDKVAEDAKNDYQEKLVKEQLITYRQVLHRTRLAEAARQREATPHMRS